MLLQLVAPTIAAIAAIIAAAMSVRASRTLQRNVDLQHEVEFRRRQLDELYGPIHMKQSTSVSLRKMLPGVQEDGTKWRLVDHVEEIKRENNEAIINCVEEILRINEEIKDTLISKSALYVSFPPPLTLSHYIAHVKLLSLAWKQGRNEDPVNRLPFPDEFDDVIEDAVRWIRKRLEELGALPKERQENSPSAHIPTPWYKAKSLEGK